MLCDRCQKDIAEIHCQKCNKRLCFKCSGGWQLREGITMCSECTDAADIIPGGFYIAPFIRREKDNGN